MLLSEIIANLLASATVYQNKTDGTLVAKTTKTAFDQIVEQSAILGNKHQNYFINTSSKYWENSGKTTYSVFFNPMRTAVIPVTSDTVASEEVS